MTNASIRGGAPDREPTSITLPLALNGYRRRLYVGRAASVYFDQHPANEWPEHTHDQDQVAGIVGDGSVKLTYKSDGGSWQTKDIHPGTWWIIPRGISHALQFTAPTDMVTIFLEPSFVADILEGQMPAIAVVSLAHLASRDQVIVHNSKTFLNLCRSQTPANALYIESIGTALGTHILRTIFLGGLLQGLHAGLSDEALARVVAHIERHYPHPVTVDDLSTAAGYSAGHFSVLFRKSMGITPHDYLMRHRLAKALDLLGTTKRKEIDIAHACGFSDDTHLARHVREVLHCQPKQLRGTGPSDYNPIFPSSQPILPTKPRL
jgi:AraC family transcriptional regulator